MKRLVAVLMLLAATACHEDDAPASSAATPSAAPSSVDVATKPPSVATSPIAPTIASAAAAPSASASSSARPVDGACGSASQPDCPLQGWMKAHLRTAVDGKDFDALQSDLKTLATLAPRQPGYDHWESIAKDGASAARLADLEAVRASCRGCHAQYKQKYRSELRARAIDAR